MIGYWGSSLGASRLGDLKAIRRRERKCQIIERADGESERAGWGDGTEEAAYKLGALRIFIFFFFCYL